jgi:hypothetical protein
VKSSKLGFLLASPLLALAACGSSEPARDAVFASAPEGQIHRAFSAASGADAAGALFLGVAYATAPASTTSCPRIAHDGGRTTITGGCSNDEGIKYEGTATFDNVPTLTGGGYDPSKPTRIEFDGFKANAQAKDPVIIDGSVTISKTSMTTELSLTADNVSSHAAIELTQGADGSVTAQDGSSIDVEKLGSAAVSGTWKPAKDGAAATGKITVTGKDVLVFDLGAADANGCAPYSVGGAVKGKECPAKPHL